MAATRKTVRLICWNPADAAARASQLRKAGYHVIADPPDAPGTIGAIRELSPDVVVIDLDRLPSHGRELGMALRASKSTCHLPLLFAGGATAKVEAIRAALPDAIYAAWSDDLAETIQRIMAMPPAPRLASRELTKDTTAGALERKLDIKPQTRFVIVAAGRNEAPWLDELLTSVPDAAVRQSRIDATTTLALYPVRTRRELIEVVKEAQHALPARASLWIIHLKQTSRLAGDFNQDDVREVALAHGFVDYKVCAVDQDWSALKFARRGVTQAKSHVMQRGIAPTKPSRAKT